MHTEIKRIKAADEKNANFVFALKTADDAKKQNVFTESIKKVLLITQYAITILL